MGPAEPVHPLYSAPGSTVLGHRQNSRAGQKSRAGKRVALATRVAPLPGISRFTSIRVSPEAVFRNPFVQNLEILTGSTLYPPMHPPIPKGSEIAISKLEVEEEEAQRQQLLGTLRQDNRLNLEGKGCNQLRLHHCTPAWVTELDSISNKQQQQKLKQ
ncbi:hypothetical protein AAY473_012246 [Plecturocebus cupreus]